ncbi:MAG: SPOR domain-containing protein [Ignavibacteriaceae bacterium]
MKFVRLYIVFIILLLPSHIFSQDVDIIPYLKQIESGNKKGVEERLPSLISKNPNSPSVLFLEGVLTKDGDKALVTYSKILDKYPKSKYADAALYRIFSYYYAAGEYYNAKKCLEDLKKDYPISPYIKIAERDIPASDQTALSKEKESNQITEEDTPKYKFTIQAGAFTNPTNADALKNNFEDNGFFSEIKDKVVAGTTFRVVYVGKFEDKNEAENFLHVINREFKLDGRIVDIP